MAKRKPYTIRTLWGIWIPDGDVDKKGCWMRHGQGRSDGPEVYTHHASARASAHYYRDIFPGCYAAKITGGAK